MRILIVQTSFLGDLVLTTPLFSELRRRFPKDHLAVLATPVSARILAGHPDVDQVLVDDKRGRDRGLRGPFRTAARLRRESFDIALSPHRSFRTALVLRLAGIPRRVGFRQSRGWFLFTETVNRDRDRHDVERNLCILRAVGVEPEECDGRLSLPVSESAARAATQLLRDAAPGSGPLFVLSPGSVWATKRWKPSGFAEVARSLVETRGARVVLVGSRDDQEVAERIERESGGAARSLAGRTDLPTLVAVIARADCLVTNDSAPLHVGSALGIPRVAIFCATTPELGFGPWGGRSSVVGKDLGCRPCARHGSMSCPRATYDCIELVDPPDVLRGIHEVLAGG